MNDGGLIAEKHSNLFKKIDDQKQRDKRQECDDKKSQKFFKNVFIQKFHFVILKRDDSVLKEH